MTGILDGLTALITDAVSPMASDELVAWLDDLGIANAKMRTMAKFAAHPQLAERNRWVQVDTSGRARTVVATTGHRGDVRPGDGRSASPRPAHRTNPPGVRCHPPEGLTCLSPSTTPGTHSTP